MLWIYLLTCAFMGLVAVIVDHFWTGEKAIHRATLREMDRKYLKALTGRDLEIYKRWRADQYNGLRP